MLRKRELFSLNYQVRFGAEIFQIADQIIASSIDSLVTRIALNTNFFCYLKKKLMRKVVEEVIE